MAQRETTSIDEILDNYFVSESIIQHRMAEPSTNEDTGHSTEYDEVEGDTDPDYFNESKNRSLVYQSEMVKSSQSDDSEKDENYEEINEDTVYVNEAKESANCIVYADLVFDDESFSSCHQAFCVFESNGSADEILISQKEPVYENQCIEEHVILISDEEDSEIDSDSEGSSHSYIDIDEEIKIQTMRCRTSTFGEGPYERGSPPSSPYIKHKTSPKPSKLTCTGMTVLDDHRVVVVTNDGEIIVFGVNGSFSFLRDFQEHFEDVTMLSDSNIAVTCGYCVRFYKVKDSDVYELTDKCFDFECTGYMTVHAIHYHHKEFVVTCNLQSVNPSPFIRVVDKKGNITKTLKIPGLVSPEYVAFSLDRKHIFVTDPKVKTLYALGRDGKIQWKKEDEEIPTSLTNLPEETLVVAYQRSFSLKLYSYQGALKKVVLAEFDGLPSPILLSYHTQSELLLFCPALHVVGKKDFIYFMKMKSSKKKNFASMFSFL